MEPVQDWFEKDHPFAFTPRAQRPTPSNPMKIQVSPRKITMKWTEEDTKTFAKVYYQWLLKNPSATRVDCKLKI